MPIGPAIAAWRAFQGGADLVDRAARVMRDQRAIGADLGGMAAVEGIELVAR